MNKLTVITGDNARCMKDYTLPLWQGSGSCIFMYPEEKLHPKCQIKFVEELHLQLKTTNVILVTFSDYILRELNDNIMCNHLLSIKESVEFNFFDTITEHTVSCVEVNIKGISEVLVDKFGIQTLCFDETINTTNHKQGELFYSMTEN